LSVVVATPGGVGGDRQQEESEREPQKSRKMG